MGVAVLALAVVVAVAVEIALPGRALYHSGWYNVGIVALLVVLLAAARKRFARTLAGWPRIAIVALCFGAVVVGFAGVVSGLLAPDDQTVVGAPGQQLRVADLGGSLAFPLASADAPSASPVTVRLERPGRSPVSIAQWPRDVGSFILKTVARTTVYVQARDLRGGHLTITQPTGIAFLSPVLLMQQRQTIAGLNLPFDSFAVPAAHRIVKAVLFSPQEAATLRGMEGLEVPAVLFAADDESDRPLPNAIALAPDGQSVTVGGLILHAVVLSYPAVEIVAAPALVPVVIGTLLVLAGLLGMARVKRNSLAS
ncbi:MAG TPA: hypothetical protein VNG31_05240 [Candidatus Baltobacteraceae bacterium]|nr:hypothetical protein [Candidatus Baltobacteraceae bacterium]